MANVDHISAGGVGVVETLRGFFGSIGESFRQYRAFRATYEELNSLSGNELADIGISRSDITRIAYDAAYGGKSDFRAS